MAALAEAPAVLAVAPLAVAPKVDTEILRPVVTTAPSTHTIVERISLREKYTLSPYNSTIR
eukprot:3934586-Rhodomonas_salina.1